MGNLHLIKLCVGIDSPDQLLQSRESRGTLHTNTRHVTRMWPKREAELLQGGSLYWVMKGVIQARQEIQQLDEITGEDGIRRCAIILKPDVIRTTAAPRRAFQGWRYLKAEDAPADLPENRLKDDALPPELARELSDIGLC